MEQQTFLKHKRVIDQNRQTLIRAQEIRESPEFQAAMSYFQLQKQRGAIKRSPSMANGYQIEVR